MGELFGGNFWGGDYPVKCPAEKVPGGLSAVYSGKIFRGVDLPGRNVPVMSGESCPGKCPRGLFGVVFRGIIVQGMFGMGNVRKNVWGATFGSPCKIISLYHINTHG